MQREMKWPGTAFVLNNFHLWKDIGRPVRITGKDPVKQEGTARLDPRLETKELDEWGKEWWKTGREERKANGESEEESEFSTKGIMK